MKERGGIEIETTMLSIYAMHALFRFCIDLPFPFVSSSVSFASNNNKIGFAHVIIDLAKARSTETENGAMCMLTSSK